MQATSTTPDLDAVVSEIAIAAPDCELARRRDLSNGSALGTDP
jgi:hypothetical protein